ncbi:MAG: imidazole glycerol phosphate synthase subunit HisH [Cyanobacteria bacterium]|nr:imidazole glycerol phosphate synthase subunit HisH [Cyanobacteriota bacterium]
MIALVDYGAGNLTSVRKALTAIGAHTWTPSVAGELGRAHGIIVPGVGHFDTTQALCDEWRAAIKATVDDGIPLLGICVGLQWLFEGSEEAADAKGFGLFKGKCFNLARPGPRSQAPSPLKVPHVGWNSLVINRPSRLMAGVSHGSQVYFTHSYAAPVVADTAAVCEYGVDFSAAVERDNVSAVQFHPEKSGDVGLHVLSNWVSSIDSSLSRRSSRNAGGA